MKRITATLPAATLCLLTVATIVAHEVTYEGTVAAVKPNPYVASSGIIATLDVQVSGRKRPMVFDITQKTRLFRGSSAVSFAEAHIEKDERVVVTVNHDDPDEGAIEVRLTAQKRE